MEECPLCLNHETRPYSADKFRRFEICLSCSLIFVPRSELVSPESEKERYDAHHNDEDDSGYHKYLNGIATSIRTHLPPKAKGLDFGCGRTTVLADKFSELAHPTDSYDVYFKQDERVWDKKYDFIVLSEVIEHLREPRKEMERLASLLTPSGLIFIKTKFSPETKEAFDQWFYKRDITHIQFFNPPSMNYLKYFLKMKDFELIDSDLSLLRLH